MLFDVSHFAYNGGFEKVLPLGVYVTCFLLILNTNVNDCVTVLYINRVHVTLGCAPVISSSSSQCIRDVFVSRQV